MSKLKKMWLKLLPSLISIPGFALMLAAHANYAFVFIGVLLVGGGIGYFYWIWNKAEVSKTKKNEKFNSLVVNERKYEFKDMEHGDMVPWKNLNTNEDQYLFLNDTELVLPDDDVQVFYYSDEYYNAITMECNKKYFAWSDTTFQKIAIGAAILVIVIEVVALIALGG